MPITPCNPFKWRHYEGVTILLCVRWYLRYPVSFRHVAEMMAERGAARRSKLHLALGSNLRPGSGSALPPALEANQQELGTG